jgi:hypothetical protein
MRQCGIEPQTSALQVLRSTTELQALTQPVPNQTNMMYICTKLSAIEFAAGGAEGREGDKDTQTKT